MMKLPLKLVDTRKGKISSAFRAARKITGNDCSSLHTPQIDLKALKCFKCSGVEEILERRPEHYDQTLNHPSGTIYSELEAASSVATPDIDICTDQPTLDEVVRAVKKLKNDLAAGCDDISPEFLKCALPHVAQAWHSLFQRVWRSGRVPVEWKDGIRMHVSLDPGVPAYDVQREAVDNYEGKTP